jgi:hypothetical protein|tara:strand:+ start:377 stop:514 length:138 start_codon:yes stop_codon:yes gene_type:complete
MTKTYNKVRTFLSQKEEEEEEERKEMRLSVCLKPYSFFFSKTLHL